MEFVTEKPRQTEIIEDVDVLVVGGGPGGVPAAVAAARKGSRTLLVERYGFLGGAATNGLMGPLFGYAYGETGLILGGIALETVRELQKRGAALPDDLVNWGAVRFDPETLKHVSDDLLLSSGAKLLLHSWAVDVAMKDGRIDAVVIEGKSGRKAIRARLVVDATGDGDIAFFAGCEYTKGRAADGRTQSMGTKFKIGGVDAAVAARSAKDLDAVAKKAIDDRVLPAYHPVWGEVSQQGVTLREGEITPTVTRCPGDATSVYDLTRAEVNIRRDTWAIVGWYRKNMPGYENAFLMETPAAVGVRETRQILGDYVLTGDDVLSSRKFSDAVARGCWFIDIHCPMGWYTSTGSLCSADCKIPWKCPAKEDPEKFLVRRTRPEKMVADSFYGIPYRCIVPRKVDNLLVSGRCISADHAGMASARVIATCYAIGQAAGTAAYLALRRKVTPRALPVEALQAELRADGVPL